LTILAVRVQKRFGERVRSILYQNNLLARDYQITYTGSHLEIPVCVKPTGEILAELNEFTIELITLNNPGLRNSAPEPFADIEASVDLPGPKKALLPRKWELIGDVLVIKFPEKLRPHREDLAEIYAKVLGAKTVMEERSGITGVTRTPHNEIIYGSESETVHVENKVKYKLDTMQLMFSSGNVSERLRMAELSCENEDIVDMFAGIGYFTLPMACYTRPNRIIACEINPTAYKYLQDNIVLNHLDDIIEPKLGDCRAKAPEGIADRIVMGILKQTSEFLPKALSVLKPEGGIIHYHESCPNELIPGGPMEKLIDAGQEKGFEVEQLNVTKVKSYAPGITHVVVDARFYRK
jgi:tRNA wybutosine-synthesizing protein 2